MKNIRVLAVIAILIGAATLGTTEYTIVTSALAQATDNATMGGNMTGGNMTGGNMSVPSATDTSGDGDDDGNGDGGDDDNDGQSGEGGENN